MVALTPINTTPGQTAIAQAQFQNEAAYKAKRDVQRVKGAIELKMDEIKLKVAQKMAEIAAKWQILKDRVDMVMVKTKEFLMVARFYPIIVLVLIVLAFFGKPLEYIMLFISAIIVTIIFGVVYILGVDYIRVVPFTVYNFIVYLIPLFAYTIIIFVVFLLVSVVIFLIAVFNGCCGGPISDIIRCDNRPESWYKTPNFHLKNMYSRGFFCGKPCMAHYQPDGTNCKKMYKYTPSYCPVAETMRIYTGASRSDKLSYFMNYNTNDFKYFLKQPSQREYILKDHFVKKIVYQESCLKSKDLMQHDNISLSICSSIDALSQNGTLSVPQSISLRGACKDAYCTSTSNYPFCTKPGKASGLDASQFIKQICKILAILIGFFLIMCMCMQFLFSKEAYEPPPPNH